MPACTIHEDVNVTYAKISSKMVNPKDIAANVEKEEDANQSPYLTYSQYIEIQHVECSPTV